MIILIPNVSLQMDLYTYLDPISICSSSAIDGYFSREVGVGHIHTEQLTIKKVKLARQSEELEAKKNNSKQPVFKCILDSYLYIPNLFIAIIFNTEFLLTERTWAIAITRNSKVL